MSQRLQQRIATLRSDKARGLSPFIMAGDGGLARTKALLHALEASGATCCELGLPFSDPIADGPILQAAATRALAHGTDHKSVLAMVQQFREEGGTLPIVLMSYCNPLIKMGWDASAKAAAIAGVDAFAIPDLPPEEATQVANAAREHGIGMVFFAAPTSSDARIQQAAEQSTGFLYIVGRVGITGTKTKFDNTVTQFLERVNALVGETPTAMGFGISSAHDVQSATRFVDLAIVGSALVQHIHQAGPADEAAVAAAKDFITALLADA